MIKQYKYLERNAGNVTETEIIKRNISLVMNVGNGIRCACQTDSRKKTRGSGGSSPIWRRIGPNSQPRLNVKWGKARRHDLAGFRNEMARIVSEM
jgi:hypothetical protein